MSAIKGVGLVQAKMKEGCDLQIICPGVWNEPACSQCVDLCECCFVLTCNFCVMVRWVTAYLGIASQWLSLVSE